MSKHRNQKGRLLAVQKILYEETDEKHRISVPTLMERLRTMDIPVERKSLYSDVDNLREYGADVILTRGKGSGYYVGQRLFDLAELKLLVDAVQCAKFIPESRTRTLTEKLERLTSRYGAKQLHRQVGNVGRVKSENKEIMYIVDAIHNAIQADKGMTFRYNEWVVDFTKPGGFCLKAKHLDKVYHISPYVLAWQEENYYLIGYDEDSGSVRHYRVDKIKDYTVTDTPRAGIDCFENFDLSEYVRGRFGMFSGKKEEVALLVKNELVGVLVDLFGKEIVLHPGEEKGWVTARIPVVLSDPFYGWVMGFGDRLRVVGPEDVVREMTRRSREIAGMYGKGRRSRKKTIPQGGTALYTEEKEKQ